MCRTDNWTPLVKGIQFGFGELRVRCDPGDLRQTVIIRDTEIDEHETPIRLPVVRTGRGDIAVRTRHRTRPHSANTVAGTCSLRLEYPRRCCTAAGSCRAATRITPVRVTGPQVLGNAVVAVDVVPGPL